LWKLSVITWAFEAARQGFGPAQVRGVKMTTEEAVDKIGAMKFDGVEIAVWNIDEFYPKREAIKEKLQAHGLELSNICCNDNVYVWSAPVYTNPDVKVRDEMVQRFEKTLDVAMELGCKSVSIWPGSDVIPLKIPYNKAWNLLIETLARCARAAEDRDLKVPLEYKPENILGSADSTLRAVKAVNSKNMGVLLDTGHAIVAREHLPTVTELLRNYLLHVHVDDNYADWDRDLPPGYVHNFEPFLKTLKEVGYKGYLSLDVWPYEDAEKEVGFGKTYLEKLILDLF